MRTIPISKFKAHALALVKAIAETGESVLVTKRGNPMVLVEPYSPAAASPQPGWLSGTVIFNDDPSDSDSNSIPEPKGSKQ